MTQILGKEGRIKARGDRLVSAVVRNQLVASGSVADVAEYLGDLRRLVGEVPKAERVFYSGKNNIAQVYLTMHEFGRRFRTSMAATVKNEQADRIEIYPARNLVEPPEDTLIAYFYATFELRELAAEQTHVNFVIQIKVDAASNRWGRLLPASFLRTTGHAILQKRFEKTFNQHLSNLIGEFKPE